ncbi:IMPACT family member in pol 5'region-like isoform X2 [Zingiber officinale]|uniref:IMPACT family member in pol 5'region-like isoform X2 n=1 Tax=Zingiber officinale TaxID=94328 RepID=UPI001C4BFAD6|nr:IMPACT family member in pol 5'region-like isoform X2 [Zingiber officinale]
MAVRVHPPCLRFASSLVNSSKSQGVATPIHGGVGGGVSTARFMSSAPSPYTTLSARVSCEREIKKSKFIAIATRISDDRSAQSFLSELGDQYRSNDDGEPSGTAGKPIYSAIESSGLDRVMVVVIRHFGGIKLGTGGLVRAYGGVASECLKGAATCLVKPKARIGMEVPFELLGAVYHQLQHFQAEDIKQDYETGNDGTTMVTFKVEYGNIVALEDAINSTCSRKIHFYKQTLA